MAIDIEIVAETVRLCRSGNFTRGAQVIEQVKQQFPEATDDTIKESVADAARRLINQHEQGRETNRLYVCQ